MRTAVVVQSRPQKSHRTEEEEEVVVVEEEAERRRARTDAQRSPNNSLPAAEKEVQYGESWSIEHLL